MRVGANATSFLSLLVVGAFAFHPAHSSERVGDATHVHALQYHARAVTALENDILALIEIVADDDRFSLYRTYNQLMGAWAQVDLSQTLLDMAVSADSPADEAAIRTTLRDQAQFALWDLDDAYTRLERDIPDAKRPEHIRANEAARSLLSETRITLRRLLADQCAPLYCATGP